MQRSSSHLGFDSDINAAVEALCNQRANNFFNHHHQHQQQQQQHTLHSHLLPQYRRQSSVPPFSEVERPHTTSYNPHHGGYLPLQGGSRYPFGLAMPLSQTPSLGTPLQVGGVGDSRLVSRPPRQMENLHISHLILCCFRLTHMCVRRASRVGRCSRAQLGLDTIFFLNYINYHQ